MIKINNTDTGHGKIRYSYRISLVLSTDNPIERMKVIMDGNEQLSEWIKSNSSHIRKYKISGHEVFFESLEVINLFKETYTGKESRDYVIKSLRKKTRPPQKEKSTEDNAGGDTKSKKHVVTVRTQKRSPKANPNKSAPKGKS